MKKISFILFMVCSLGIYTTKAQEIYSTLEILDINNGERTQVKKFPYLIEAPNWTTDNYLIYNSGGKLYKLHAYKDELPEEIYTSYANRCNNDHVLSADGQKIAISHATKEDHKSRIYTLPISGGEPTLITPLAPSYLHGWSPDGKYLAYCAERNGEYDIYIIPSEGGEEIRLTDTAGLDDGPEYSPCGKYIWFNSVRSGLMQIWQMDQDGNNQKQMTFDNTRNGWFPHISPNGKDVVYLTYHKEDVDPGSHPANKNVELWLMPAAGGEPRLLTKLFGGQGSLNVNSWNPESNKIAFVSYSTK